MLHLNEIRVAMTEQELKRSLAPLTFPQLPWKLPFKKEDGKRRQGKKNELTATASDGRALTDTISFQDLALNGGRELALPDVPAIADIQFANHKSTIPLFVSGNSARANISLPLDEVPWRIRRQNDAIFPASGGGRLDFLKTGLYLSPRGKFLERRIVLHNASPRTVQITVTPDEDWLVAEPSKFALDPRGSSHVVLRLVLEKLSPGKNRAKVKIKGADVPLTFNVQVNASLRQMPVLVNKEMELRLAGIGPTVDLELELLFAAPGEVKGTVLDSLHKTCRNFQVFGSTGATTVSINLPTSKLPEVGQEVWPLKVCLDIDGILQTHSFHVRLLRELQFQPQMAVLRDDASVSALAAHVEGAPVKLLPELVPSGIAVETRQNQILISKAANSAPQSQLNWLKVCDEVSGEHALFPVLLWSERQ